jgi:hypothetical protein
MSATSQIADFSTWQRTSSTGRSVAIGADQPSNATLEILPLEAKHRSDRTSWLKARQILGQLVRLPNGWNGGRGERPDSQTIAFAAIGLAQLENSGVPAPTINPSPDGAIYAEWHSSGLDVEVIFEAPYKVIALIEDARGDLENFDGEDNDLTHASEALRILRSR